MVKHAGASGYRLDERGFFRIRLEEPADAQENSALQSRLEQNLLECAQQIQSTLGLHVLPEVRTSHAQIRGLDGSMIYWIAATLAIPTAYLGKKVVDAAAAQVGTHLGKALLALVSEDRGHGAALDRELQLYIDVPVLCDTPAGTVEQALPIRILGIDPDARETHVDLAGFATALAHFLDRDSLPVGLGTVPRLWQVRYDSRQSSIEIVRVERTTSPRIDEPHD